MKKTINNFLISILLFTLQSYGGNNLQRDIENSLTRKRVDLGIFMSAVRKDTNLQRIITQMKNEQTLAMQYLEAFTKYQYLLQKKETFLSETYKSLLVAD